MSTVYAQASSEIGSFSLTGPDLLAPDGRGVAAIRQAEQAAVRAAGQQALRRAQGLYSPAPVKAGWKVSTLSVGALKVTLTNPEPLLRWIDEPTKAHVIRARVKAALFWPGAAHPVKSVQHPGTPGKHRLDALPGVIAALFEAQLDRRVTPLLQGQEFSVAGGFEAWE